MANPADFQKQIAALPIKMKRKLAKSIQDEAAKLATAIQQAAPVDSGTLRDSVKVRRAKNDLTLQVTAGGDTTTKGTAGPHGQADYAIFVEMGTREHPAQPFFYNTARAMQGEIHSNTSDSIDEVLND